MKAIDEKKLQGKDLISVKTLSALTDTPAKTIRDWVLKADETGIPFVKLRHQLRFPVPQIQNWYMGGLVGKKASSVVLGKSR